MNSILTYWDARLENWALWKCGSGLLPALAMDGTWDDGAPRPPIPLVGEATDTDNLVSRLSADHRGAVTIMYVWSDPICERVRRCGIHKDTLADRVRAAKFRLDDMDQARKIATRQAMRLVTA